MMVGFLSGGAWMDAWNLYIAQRSSAAELRSGMHQLQLAYCQCMPTFMTVTWTAKMIHLSLMDIVQQEWHDVIEYSFL